MEYLSNATQLAPSELIPVPVPQRRRHCNAFRLRKMRQSRARKAAAKVSPARTWATMKIGARASAKDAGPRGLRASAGLSILAVRAAIATFVTELP